MLGLPAGITACLFDLDGVLTRTAVVHQAAWTEVFDAYLVPRGLARFTAADYLSYVDGRPRRDGVRTFLAARGLSTSEAEVTTVAEHKNEVLRAMLLADGVHTYPGSVDYLRAAATAGLRRAVVSASANTREVLRAAHLDGAVEVIIDGVVAERDGLRGKPHPDTFLAAAQALGVQPAAAAVFEDAEAGVTAGRAGGFGFVVGVDRAGRGPAGSAQPARLRDAGADVVVPDLGELLRARQP